MSKKKIIVIGTGQQAKVTIDNIEEQNKYEIFGLIESDNKNNSVNNIYGYNIVCSDSEIENLLNDNEDILGYILGIGIGVDGSLKIRNKLANKLDKILEPVNIIHPSANVSRRAKIGKGNIIEAFSKICNDSIVGDHCLIQSFSSINHDQIIGNNTMIACNVTLAGKKIGNNTIIAEGSSIGFKKNIGNNCLVMDGSVLTKNMPDDHIAYGNPAKVIKKNDNIMKMLYKETKT